MRIDLDTAFLDDGIRSTNFFNGRLLSAEDLTQEQKARKEALKQFGSQSPMGRPGQPAEMAPVFVFLASPASRMTTGAAITVDGGWTAI